MSRRAAGIAAIARSRRARAVAQLTPPAPAPAGPSVVQASFELAHDPIACLDFGCRECLAPYLDEAAS